MIEAKYSPRFSFPHVVVHINDLSGYQGELPLVEAEDPSLLATLVVSGMPMGEDGKVIKVTRSDVAGVAFGLNNITSDDRKKFGQAIDYPLSIIDQGAPVQLLRVTPEDATFAFVTILVDYRWDDSNDEEPLLHIRFRKESTVPAGAILSNFKTRDRLAQAIINDISKKHDATEPGGWNTRVLGVVVSAGRGSVYNGMNFSIDLANQANHPANVRYIFTTTDENRGIAVESFTASLVNIDNAARYDYTETVNNLIAQRVVGSSIVVPYINEDAVREVFALYKAKYKEQLETQKWIGNEFIVNTYKTLNVNTFDIFYGRYIYEGNIDQNLPFLQIDEINNDIPRLDEAHLAKIPMSEETGFIESYMQDKMMSQCYGINNAGDTTYVGDVYLTTIGSKMRSPRLSVVTSINQYTGAITSVTFSKVFPLSSSTAFDRTKSVNITAVYASEEEKTNAQAALNTGDVVAVKYENGFKMYTRSADGFYEYNGINMILRAIDYNEMSDSGLGNVLGTYDSSASEQYTGDACRRVGFSVVDLSTGTMYINKYNINDKHSGAIAETNRIPTSYNATKFGTVPIRAGINKTSPVGSSYDILVYNDTDVLSWTLNNVEIGSAGSGYEIGDVITIPTIEGISLTVTGISTTDNAVASFTIAGTASSRVTGTSIATTTEGSGTGFTINLTNDDYTMGTIKSDAVPDSITRYNVTGVTGSIFKVQKSTILIPDNYYTSQYGDPISSENGGYSLENGYTGFFDDEDYNSITFKYRYAARLVDAFRGQNGMDKRILSPSRVPVKFLFDAGFNTVVNSSPVINNEIDIPDAIAGSTMYTEEEKDQILFHPEILNGLTYADIDVKQAMYDLTIHRIYDGIDDARRPLGPGSGLSLHLDSGIVDAATILLINKSFARRFTNPNASWDIGGYKTPSGEVFTYTKRIVDNLFRHIKTYSINKPFVGNYSAIAQNEYVECYPDISMEDVDERELFYKSGGNAWIPDSYGVLKRQSQRTFKQDDMTSDLIQENNMRTLSQLVYLLKNKIEGILLEYSDDSVLQGLKDECNNMFSNWVGNLVQVLNINFKRDIDIQGRDIVVCTCDVTFRGLVLTVPVIVNVNRRSS